MGGSDILLDVLHKAGIFGFINKKLGKRSKRAEYSYSEGILMWFLSVCGGAKRLENVYNNKDRFKRNPRFNKFISPDTLSYMFKEISVKNDYYKKVSKVKGEKKLASMHIDNADVKNHKKEDLNETNLNHKLNELLVDMALKTGLLKKGVKYTLDYDTTIIETTIHGSRKHYKGNGNTGYAPSLACINKIPLVIENRNGNTVSFFNIVSNVENIINMLTEKGILVEKIRIDAAGYNSLLTDMLNRKGIKFYIRARPKGLYDDLGDIFNWQTNTIYGQKMEIGDLYRPFGEWATRFIVAQKEDGGIWVIMTNDTTLDCKQAIKFYGMRGDAENLFKYLKGDFGWDLMAMRTLSHNTVYLCIQALCYQLYTFMIRKFAGVVNFVWNNMRLPTFIDKFMKVPTRWEGTDLVFCCTDKDYSGLAGFT